MKVLTISVIYINKKKTVKEKTKTEKKEEQISEYMILSVKKYVTMLLHWEK